jgi:hypothetical protein
MWPLTFGSHVRSSRFNLTSGHVGRALKIQPTSWQIMVTTNPRFNAEHIPLGKRVHSIIAAHVLPEPQIELKRFPKLPADVNIVPVSFPDLFMDSTVN